MEFDEYKVTRINNSDIVLPIIMRFCLDVIYALCIVGNSEYGFRFEFNFFRYLISLSITFFYSLIAKWVFTRNDFYSNCFYLLIILYFIPSETVISFNSNLSLYHVFVLLYFTVSFIFYYTYCKINRYCEIEAGSLIGHEIALFSFLGVSVVLLYLSYKWSGFRVFISINDVYRYRIAARSLSIPVFLSYLRSWASILLSIFFVYFVINKKYIVSLFIILLHFLDYGFDGQKIILFRLMLEIIIAFFYNEKTRHSIPLCITSVSLISVLEYIVRGKSLIAQNIIRRIMILPPFLGSYAFDFFSRFEPDYLRTSFLRHFGFVSPYNAAGGIPRTLGLAYFNSNEMAADVGLAGDAFSQFGWLGFIISPLLISCFLGLMSRFSNKIDNRVVYLTSFIFALVFIDTSFFTILLTNGYLVVMMLFLFNNHSEEVQLKMI